MSDEANEVPPPRRNDRDGKAAFLRATFWAVLLGVFVVSVWPSPLDMPYVRSDKLQHALAFLCLTLLGAAAYPRLSPVGLVLGLALYGALIEAVQAIPALNRQTEFLDWVADIGAASLAAAALLAWRTFRRDA